MSASTCDTNPDCRIKFKPDPVTQVRSDCSDIAGSHVSSVQAFLRP